MNQDKITRLIQQLNDRRWTVRCRVLDQLAGGDLDATDLIPKLWEIALDDPSDQVRKSAVRAILSLEKDRSALLERLCSFLRGSDVERRRVALHMLPIIEVAEEQKENLLTLLWRLMRAENEPRILRDCLTAIVSLSSSGELVAATLLADGRIEEAKKRRLVTAGEIREALIRLCEQHPDAVLSLVVEILVSGDRNEIEEGIDLLGDLISAVPSSWNREVLEALWQAVTFYGLGFDVYCRISSPGMALLRLVNDPSMPQETVGCILLTDTPEGVLQKYWNENRNICLAYLLEALVHSDWAVRTAGADWLRYNAADLPFDLFEEVERALERRIREDTDPDVHRSAEKALATLIRRRQEHRAIGQGELIRLVQDETLDDETRSQAIESLVKMGSLEAVGAIIREWVQWIASGDHVLLTDLAADLLRSSKQAVLPLVDQLERPLLSPELLHYPNDQLKETEVKIQRRIVKLLSEMSEERFFGEKSRLYMDVVAELNIHAVPVLAEMLPEDGDIEIRDWAARLLTNLGGREAVAAITRAITGEERTRKFRQALLATYYLEPSKARGEQASQTLQEAFFEARRTLRLSQGLNVAVFVVGLSVLAFGLVTSILGHEISSRILGTLTALGALGGLIWQLINDPLDRIQRSMTDLVQIEAAFTSFIWELNLNSTFIQSQYVAEGKLSEDSTARTIERIQEAKNITMSLVALHTGETGRSPGGHMRQLGSPASENNVVAGVPVRDPHDARGGRYPEADHHEQAD